MVPVTIRYTTNYLDINLSSLLATGGKHKFYSFILNGEGDKIMLPIVSPIVEEQARLLNGCKLQLEIEFKPLGERGQGQEGPIAEAPGLQLTEVVVEGALSAVLADEAPLDKRRTGGGGGADLLGCRALVRQLADLAVLAHVVVLADTGVAALLGDAGALVLAGVGVAHVHLDVADVVVLLSREPQGTLAGVGLDWVDGSEENTFPVHEMLC